MKILFPLLGLILIPFLTQTVYANHYNSIGIDDVWLWREYDSNNGVTYDVDCAFLTDDGVDNVRIMINDLGGTDGGHCMIIKTFTRSDIQNVGGSNDFSFRFEHGSDTSPFYTAVSVLDGNYEQYYDSTLSVFQDDFTSTNTWEVGSLDPGTWGDLENPSSGVTTSLNCGNDQTAGTRTITCTIDNTEWGRALDTEVTVILWIGRGTSSLSSNFYLHPESFSITNTPNGTLSWNWPETVDELSNWNTYGYSELQLNGTLHDYGIFISLDESVPDPPTNLFTVTGGSDITLFWTEPAFNGYDPITGYKIERESPIGNGFSTINANTGNTDTTYVDDTANPGTEYNYRVRAINSHGESLPSNESKDGTGSSGIDTTPDVTCDDGDSIFELFAPAITTTTATLCWNGDLLSQGNLTGYQINYTTPWGDPITIVSGQNNTQNNSTTYLVQNLASNTDYSFRVQSWYSWVGQTSNVTNILNITTLDSSFDIGNLKFDGATNLNQFDWQFSKDDNCSIGEVCPDNTPTNVLINYPDSFNATCTVFTKFAKTNSTYSNLSTTPTGIDRQYANFTFYGINKDVVTIDCIDENTNSTGKYIITNTDFPLLTQIDQFKDGTFGTTGQFGIFDFTTLAVIILSMIGFNRVHPGVGAVFSMIVIGVAAYFQIIVWYSAVFGVLAIVVMVALVMHNRNDVQN